MLMGLDASAAGMRLTCQADESQYAIKWDSERIPCRVEQRGYSPVKENGLGLIMGCLIVEDVGQSQ